MDFCLHLHLMPGTILCVPMVLAMIFFEFQVMGLHHVLDT